MLAMNLLANVSSFEAQTLIGWLVVIGCLIGAAWCFLHNAVIGGVGLLVVAIIAGALLL